MTSFYKYDQSEHLENSRKEILSDEMAALLQSMQRPRFAPGSARRLARYLLVMGLLSAIVFGAHLIWQPEMLTGERNSAISQEIAVEAATHETISNSSHTFEIIEQKSEPLHIEAFMQLIIGVFAITFIASACLIVAGKRYTRNRWLA